MEPLVSCLTVTKGRMELLRRAIACFKAQTYPNLELVLVTDSPGVAETASKMDPRIRVVDLPPRNPSYTLGELRNISVDNSRGEYLTQWDDDDWYHPERIATQLREMKIRNVDVSFLFRWTIAWPARDLYAYSLHREWEGSVIGKRGVFEQFRYPHEVRGEDTIWVDSLKHARIHMFRLDRPDLYIYTCHGSNTWDEGHFAKYIFNMHVMPLSAEEKERAKRNLGLI